MLIELHILLFWHDLMCKPLSTPDPPGDSQADILPPSPLGGLTGSNNWFISLFHFSSDTSTMNGLDTSKGRQMLYHFTRWR